MRIFRHTLATGEPYVTPERAELRLDRGVVEYYEWRLDRITLPDGRYGLVCYFRDISAQVGRAHGSRRAARRCARPTGARTSSSPRSRTSCATRSRRSATRSQMLRLAGDDGAVARSACAR